MRRASYIVLFATTAVILLLFLFPRSLGNSTDPCNQCHSTYYQYLDILEGNSANKIPSTINVGETKTVTIVVENNVNTAQYSTISDVCVSLSSKNGHFSVTAPTCNIGDLQSGTATATWQITGVSSGVDSLSITATGDNHEMGVPFSDGYSPSPLITVAQSTSSSSPTPTSASTPTPTSASTPTPKSASTPGSTTTPKSTLAPNTTPMPTQSASSVTSLTPTPSTPEFPSLSILILLAVSAASLLALKKRRILH